MTTKKDIPNLLKVKVLYDSETIEDMVLFRYNRIIKGGYDFSHSTRYFQQLC